MQKTLLSELLTSKGNIVILENPFAFNGDKRAAFNHVKKCLGNSTEVLDDEYHEQKKCFTIIVENENVISDNDHLFMDFMPDESGEKTLTKVYFQPSFGEDLDEDWSKEGFEKVFELVKKAVADNLEKSDRNEFSYSRIDDGKESDFFQYRLQTGGHIYTLTGENNWQKMRTNIVLEPAA